MKPSQRQRIAKKMRLIKEERFKLHTKCTFGQDKPLAERLQYVSGVGEHVTYCLTQTLTLQHPSHMSLEQM